MIYSGTNALAYNGSSLTNETVGANRNNVTSSSDNIKWTFESVTGGGYRIFYKSGNTTYYLGIDYNNRLTLTTNVNDAETWYYDSTDHQLYRITYFYYYAYYYWMLTL